MVLVPRVQRAKLNPARVGTARSPSILLAPPPISAVLQETTTPNCAVFLAHPVYLSIPFANLCISSPWQYCATCRRHEILCYVLCQMTHLIHRSQIKIISSALCFHAFFIFFFLLSQRLYFTTKENRVRKKVPVFSLFFYFLAKRGDLVCVDLWQPNGPIVRVLAAVEWEWLGGSGRLGNRRVSLPVSSPQISRGLTRAVTWYLAVRSRWLAGWAMARRAIHVACSFVSAFVFAKRVQHSVDNAVIYKSFNILVSFPD